jgi:hypothetical protein
MSFYGLDPLSPQRAMSTAKVDCVLLTLAMMSYSTPAYRIQHADARNRCMKWRQKKTDVAFASYSCFFPDVHGSRGLAKRLQDQHAQVPCHV